MSVAVTVSADLEGLLAALTHDNWFEMLPVIHDAYREQKDEAGDAVAWLIANKKRPHDVGKRFGWRRHVESDEYSRETRITAQYDAEIVRLNKHVLWTHTIQPQLTAFVQVWLTGMRPY
jgi:hypothetical protein